MAENLPFDQIKTPNSISPAHVLALYMRLFEQLKNTQTQTVYCHCVWNFPPPFAYGQATAITSSVHNFQTFLTALEPSLGMAMRMNAQSAGDTLHLDWLPLLITL
jgi:hypothetical protein